MAAGQHTLCSSLDPEVFPGPGRVLGEPHLIPEALGFLAAPPSTWHGQQQSASPQLSSTR